MRTHARTSIVSTEFARATLVAALWLAAAASAFAGDSNPASAPGSAPAAASAALSADEAAARVAQADEQVKQHLKSKDLDALRKDLDAVEKLVPRVADAKLRAKALSLVSSIFAASTDDAHQRVVIRSIGTIGEPSLFKHVRPFLAQPNPKEIPPLLLDAITATAKLRPVDAVAPLLSIVQKSKKMEAAAAAMRAFAGYGAMKSVRGKILQELIATTEKDKPGVGKRWDNSSGDPYETGTTRTGDDAVTRWGALSAALVETLNKLTGQNCATAEDWFALHDRYKTRLDELFEAK
jgi:hypothetical protein